MQVPLKYKLLRPIPEIQESFEIQRLPKIEPYPKFITIEAQEQNSGVIYLSDSPEYFDPKEEMFGFESLSPGEKKIFEIDQNRAVGLDLSSIYYMGTITGDRLIVSYLEEANG